jgi:hypothetical protein
LEGYAKGFRAEMIQINFILGLRMELAAKRTNWAGPIISVYRGRPEVAGGASNRCF